MTAVVLDASAAAELAARTSLGRRLRDLAPENAEWWVPDHLYVEAGGALRKMALRELITRERADAALARLPALPVTVVRSKPLIAEAWQLRHNLTLADAVYVALARHIDAALLTGDRKLASAPTLPIQVIHLSAAD